MNPVPTYVSVPTFGGSATRVTPDSTTYSTGYVPGQGFPAQHENYFMYGLTQNHNVAESQITSIQNEIINLLAQYSITPNSSITTQLRDLFVAQLALKLNSASYTASDVLAKLLTVDTDTSGINATTLKSVTPGSGGLAALAKNVTIWASDNDGAGSGLLAEGIQTSTITDLDLDPSTLGLAVGETRTSYGSSPSGDIFGGSAFTWTVTRAASTLWNVLAYAGANGGVARRRYTGGAWGAWRQFDPYRTYIGGSVSGTVTLPSIEIGETMEAWYNPSSSCSPTFPATGTYNANQLINNVNCVTYYARAGGSVAVSTSTVFSIIYTRTA